MVQVPQAVAHVAAAFGLGAGSLRALSGDSGSAWGLQEVPGPGHGTSSGQARLVHLDLHPFKILADANGEVTGVLDWANAAAGDPDPARTWTILTLDPAARARAAEPGWAELRDGWGESGRLHDVPAAHRAWACAFMLSDLAGRYAADQLQHIADALNEAKAACADRT